MPVCPCVLTLACMLLLFLPFSLLWEQLTGREHLLFYGRLKNLERRELQEAVVESLKSVNLFAGGVRQDGMR